MDTNTQRIIDRWREGALAELDAAKVLYDSGLLRQALFWTHLAIEKALKAHVVQKPVNMRRIHIRFQNLSTLAIFI